MRITVGHLRRLIKEEFKRALNENDESEQSVVDIIDNTDPAYLKKTFDTRNPGSAIQAGSVFSEPQTAESLKAAEWSRLSTSAVKSPAIAFTAKIPGVLGYVPIDKLPTDMPVRFQLSHGGKGGKSGKATEVVAAFSTDAAKVDNTTLIAGPNEKGEYAVWTFHPGDPAPMGEEIAIETVKDKFPELRGTMADAKALGFDFVKRVEKLEESNDTENPLFEGWQRLAGLI